jgi:hypothetical protein
MRRLPPVYPVAFVLAALLTLYVNAGEPITVLARPIIVAVLGAFVVQAICSALVRNHDGGALVALALFLILAGLWPLALVLGALPLWWGTISLSRRARGQSSLPRDPLLLGGRILQVFAIALLAVVTLSGILAGAFAWPTLPAAERGANASGDPPNVYLIQLDGYPGFDAVRALGFSNDAFAEGLEALGFEVSREARSNYSQTWPTLASMFQMRYLDEEPGLLPSPADLGEQRRRLHQLMNRGRALSTLHELGYGVSTLTSPFSSTDLSTADTVTRAAQLNEFEELLLRKSGVLSLLGDPAEDWVADQARSWIEANIDAIGAVPGPRLVFNHVMAPHPPFLFASDGEETPLRDCYPRSCPFWVTELAGTETSVEEYSQALQEELAYLNGRVLDRLTRLVADDPDAIVIVYSDHGMRFDEANVAEHFEILFAARTPGRTGVFPDSVSLVNLFPLLFNSYADTGLPVHDYRAWRSGLLPLDLTPVAAEEGRQ